jgi:hypothetical protein
MPARIKLADVSATTLADAECVVAVDPDVPAYYTQVWTLTDASGDKAVEVEINSDDPDHLPRLKQLVEDIKGPLVESLFKFDE